VVDRWENARAGLEADATGLYATGGFPRAAEQRIVSEALYSRHHYLARKSPGHVRKSAWRYPEPRAYYFSSIDRC
jgi:hypothetical protein